MDAPAKNDVRERLTGEALREALERFLSRRPAAVHADGDGDAAAPADPQEEPAATSCG
jgi:hypothetical protein